MREREREGMGGKNGQWDERLGERDSLSQSLIPEREREGRIRMGRGVRDWEREGMRGHNGQGDEREGEIGKERRECYSPPSVGRVRFC